MIFSKYEGAGNDFILIDDRALLFDPSIVPKLCHRNFGIGADGVILLQNDTQADFRMRIFNRDGSEAESCGNGLRCLMRFIGDLGAAQKVVKISTMNRLVEAFFEGDKIGIKMGEPSKLCLNLPLNVDGKTWTVHTVDTGVPHLVQFVDDVEQVDVSSIGSKLRHHRAFGPKGTNVNFVSARPDGSLSVRTFERGVEGETLACGTGAVAVGVIAAHILEMPSKIRTHFKGGEIEISFSDRGLLDLCMIGSAKRVFTGHFS